eukprot:7586408-Alexandrium_andersonii.AAC.1
MVRCSLWLSESGSPVPSGDCDQQYVRVGPFLSRLEQTHHMSEQIMSLVPNCRKEGTSNGQQHFKQF